jgi:hypothetical protein
MPLGYRYHVSEIHYHFTTNPSSPLAYYLIAVDISYESATRELRSYQHASQRNFMIFDAT